MFNNLYLDLGLLAVDYATTMYHELNEKIEKASKLLYEFGTKITVLAINVPPLTLFAIDYFTDNLTDESFYLPSPVV